MRRDNVTSVYRQSVGRGRPHGRRIVAAFFIADLLIALPIAVTAGPPPSHRDISVEISVRNDDCREITVDYVITWRGLRGGADENVGSIALQAYPVGYPLTDVAPEPGRKTDKQKGTLTGQLTRESGYFDHQTYPGSSYQVIVRTSDDGAEVASDPVTIPECVPMSTQSGPSAGGTSVTVFGGGTFGGPSFTMSSTVILAGTEAISPTEVGADGTWLTFVTPVGSPDTCVSVWTDPGLPFPLPDFCYVS